MTRISPERHGATAGRSVGKRRGPGSTRPRPHAGTRRALEPSFPIVGIGASAGGVEAVTELLSQLPPDTGRAFVVILHLAPSHPSLLADVLRKATPMPVTEVADGTRVDPDHVYVIPPDRDLALRAGTLAVIARTGEARQRPHMPIDRFFRSLAEDRQTAAIGVVLSGTATDGTKGLDEIKLHGGITFAQDPATARYPDMPQSAIAAGAAAQVLSIQGIAAELARLARPPGARKSSSGSRRSSGSGDGPPESAGDRVVHKICDRLRVQTGIDFRSYKPSTIRRRIARRMTVHKVGRLGDYLALLDDDPREVHALAEDALIHVTGFFRDPKVFDALEARVLPEILRHETRDAPAIRIWVPGCSTGEEVYSIAIVLAELLGDGLHRASIQIFGSDVSAGAVDKARGAYYPDTISRDVTEQRLRRFFTKVDHGYRIGKLLRDLCVFVKHDITSDPPFSRLDLISCRNLLIYFSTELQHKVIPLLHYALNDPGFLLLGHSEAISGFNRLFTLEDRTNKIYRRKPGRARLTASFPAAPPSELQPAAAGPRPRSAAPVAGDLQREADRVLQTRYGPPAVVVNDALDIVFTRGRTGPYLELPSGDARLNLLSMAREGLLSDLRMALHRARTDGTTVRREGHVRIEGTIRSVEIEVSPLRPGGTGRDPYFLVVFVEPRARAGEPAPRAAGGKRGAREPRGEKRLTRKLHEELEATRGYLQSVIEDRSNTNDELASMNEELLSSNEELQSTNEELETAKEELQSANEELTTVNDELQGRNAELTQVNNDLSNVMAGIEVPIVLVGLDHRIRRFTPCAAETMKLLASDIGRPIHGINPHVAVHDLDRSVAAAIDAEQVVEAEVQHESGRWYRLQILPYRTAEHTIDGAVVLLIDIDAPKRALEERERLLEQLRHERSFLEAVVQQMSAGLVIAEAPSGRLILANRTMEQILGHPLPPAASTAEYRLYRGLHADGRPYDPGEWPLARSTESGETVISERIVLQRADGRFTTVLTSSAPVRDADGKIIAGVATFLDISRDIAASERADREQRLLAQTSMLFSDVLDLDKMLQQMVRLVVPELADWCIIDLQEEGSPIRQAAIAHADREKEQRARELSRHLPPDPQLDHGVGQVMRTRRSEIYPLVTEDGWIASALSVDDPGVLRELGARSYICVPLAARDGVVGALSLIRGDGSEHYDEHSLQLVEELGQRFAIAIDNARLHRTTVEAVRARNEFFSIAAHELNTPIGTLLLHVQGMQLRSEQGQPMTPEVQLKSLRLIERQVERLDQLVNTLLDVSRLATGKFELQRERVDLATLTREVVARFEAQAKQVGAEVTVHTQRPVEGMWDRLRLEQVVANLVSNALKYGAGKPSAITVDADAATARLVVQDHGIGIAAEGLQRIFNKFERAVSAQHYAGLGMGLFITRQIVEAHGGVIRAASEPGNGSTFTVELPREPGSSAGSAEPESRPS